MAHWRVKVARVVVEDGWVVVEAEHRHQALVAARCPVDWKEIETAFESTHTAIEPVMAEQIGGYNEEADAMQAWHELRERVDRSNNKGDC
jgi:tRNA A-37 threonylcarbamoyl transferase component Bud32